jgi:REP element-mobilizing transposase RayT
VTLRASREVAFLREEMVFAEVKRALAFANREAFRIVAFSVQRDHVHLVIEADDAECLRSGMQGLTTRVARAINRALRRRGRVWADRYHRRDLTTPTDVRNLLVYVLQNHKKHRMPEAAGLDPRSSAPLFLGWNACGEALRRRLPGSSIDRTPAIQFPRTWLLSTGWWLRGGGPLDPREAPRPA